ncbi:MAG: hypothetical protein H7Y37_18520 [Anaerolineae bacterium]|nr:hypothetical protein [Gloeobacterales cyanobacterium ES-bin-313]
MQIRIMEFDGSFELESAAKETLFALLHGSTFRQQVSTGAQCKDVTFLELLFQPVPYSTNTPHGMPRAFEPYHNSEDYLVVNVPANFIFQARISRPSRLCAIYRKVLRD